MRFFNGVFGLLLVVVMACTGFAQIPARNGHGAWPNLDTARTETNNMRSNALAALTEAQTLKADAIFWRQLCIYRIAQCTYLLGEPQFIGTEEQKEGFTTEKDAIEAAWTSAVNELNSLSDALSTASGDFAEGEWSYDPDSFSNLEDSFIKYKAAYDAVSGLFAAQLEACRGDLAGYAIQAYELEQAILSYSSYEGP